MAIWSTLGTGAKAGVIGVAALVVAGGAALLLGLAGSQTPKAPAPAPALSSAPVSTPEVGTNPPEAAAPGTPDTPDAVAEPLADPGATAEPDPAPQAETTAQAAAPGPEVDTFSLSLDGTAVIAGRGGPGASLVLRLEGAEIASLMIDAGGKFATVLDLPPSELPRTLSLVQRGADGQEHPSDTVIIVAPFAAPAPAPAPAVAAPETEAIAQSDTPPQDASPTPSNLAVSGQEVRVLRPADAGVPLSIESIAYAQDGAVVISGRGPALTMIRLYFDNTARIETPTDASGQWRSTLDDIAPGVYTLRADALDDVGKVVARAQTPFLREAPEQLAALIDGDTQPAQAESLREVETVTAPEAAAEPAPQAAPGVAVDTSVEVETVTEQSAPQETAPQAAVRADIITVQPGYTLWGIARDAYGDGVQFVKVFEANRAQIRNPDLIYPGQVFALPAP